MNEKVSFWKTVVISAFIFLFGYLMGNIFDLGKIKSISLEGYEYSALESVDATPCNATTSNATSSNTIPCTATTSNATSSNTVPCTATTSNVNSNNVNTTNSSTNSTSVNTNTSTSTSNQTVSNQSVSFENNKITATQIKEINDSTKPLNVTLNCDSNSVVSSSMFDAIKKSNSELTLVYGKNKMTFLGSSILQSKDIDFKVSVTEIIKDDNLKEFTDSGLVIEFPNNNNLPGNALVSINIDPQYSSYFSNGVLSAYYYNESTDRLELVANNLKITNNTVEFNIVHNSSYVLTSSAINQDKNTAETVVRFVNNKLIYIIVIAVSVVLIITVTVIILVQRKKKLGRMI